MTERPHVNHVPVMTGGQGREEVRRFYADHFVGRWPADMRTRLVSRTAGQGRVVDELVASFTHDLEIPAILPGDPARRSCPACRRPGAGSSCRS